MRKNKLYTLAKRVKTKIKIHFLVIGILSLISISCTSTPSGGRVLVQDQGVLVTELHSNHSAISLSLIHEDGAEVSSAIFELKPHDNFRVLSLPTGKYTWKAIEVDGWKTDIKGDFTFVIKQGTLNYIGDVLLKVDGDDVRINFINKSTAIKSRLKEDYGHLYNKFPYEVNITKTEEY